MKQQTQEQNYERIKKVYEALGRDIPDESRTALQGVKITIELSDRLDVTICECLMPLDASGVDAQ